MPTAAVAGTILLVVFCLCLVITEATELVLLLKGAAMARRSRSTGSAGDALLKSPLVPGIAVIAVPPDASAGSFKQVRSLLKMRAGDAEVVAVLNGPSEADRMLWMKEFRLEPSNRAASRAAEPVRCVYRSRDPISLLVIDRQAGTTAECLNTALSYTEAPLVAVVDRAAEVSEEALLRTLERLIAGPERTIAVCAIGPAPAATGLPALLYRLEYLRAWLGRCAMASWNSALPAPGSLTLFERDAILRLGGFRGGALEMVMRLHRILRTTGSDERIAFLPLPAASPRLPHSWKELRTARARIRSEERQSVATSGFLHHYLRPVATMAVVVMAWASFGLGWMDPRHLVHLLGATVIFRILTSMSAVLLSEFAAPDCTGARDLPALFFSAVFFWTN